MKKPIYILIAIILILPTFFFNLGTAEREFISKEKLITELNLKQEIEIVKKSLVDITGDGIKEQVFFLGQSPAGPDPLFYVP